MTACTEWSPLLDEYLDGTLAAPDQARVEAHLAGCAACRAELAALRELTAAARALPPSLTPDSDAWPAIARRTMARPTVRSRWWLQAAAAVALLVAGYGLAQWHGRAAGDGYPAARAAYEQASTHLARELTRGAGALPATTREVVARNLAIIDQAIAEAEAALRDEPGNRALEQMLLARYEQRLALLRRAVAAGRQQT